MDCTIKVTLNVLIYFFAISSHCDKSEASLEKQKYFKKIKDYGKHASMHISYMYSNFKHLTNEILYICTEEKINIFMVDLWPKNTLIFKWFIYKLNLYTSYDQKGIMLDKSNLTKHIFAVNLILEQFLTMAQRLL